MSLYCYCKRTQSPPFCDGSHTMPRPRPEAEPAPEPAPVPPDDSSKDSAT
jgi:CDGSH-type Zn-finger protein